MWFVWIFGYCVLLFHTSFKRTVSGCGCLVAGILNISAGVSQSLAWQSELSETSKLLKTWHPFVAHNHNSVYYDEFWQPFIKAQLLVNAEETKSNAVPMQIKCSGWTPAKSLHWHGAWYSAIWRFCCTDCR